LQREYMKEHLNMRSTPKLQGYVTRIELFVDGGVARI